MGLEVVRLGAPNRNPRDALTGLLVDITRFAQSPDVIRVLAEQEAEGRHLYAVEFSSRIGGEMFWLVEATQGSDGCWYAGRSGDAAAPDELTGPTPRVNLCVGSLKGNRYAGFIAGGFVVDPHHQVARVELRDGAGVVLDAPVVNGAVLFFHRDQLEAPLTVTMRNGSSEIVGEHPFPLE